MRIVKTSRLFILFLILFTNISCDQVSKTMVREQVAYHEKITIINNHFTVTRVENTGAFLSAGNTLPKHLKFIALSLFPLLVIGFGIFYISTNSNINKIGLIGFCFIISGGIGNIFDRLVYGSVTDFLHIKIGILQTGIFNLADVSVLIGMAIILSYSFLKRS